MGGEICERCSQIAYHFSFVISAEEAHLGLRNRTHPRVLEAMTDVAFGRKSDEQNHRRIPVLATTTSYVLGILDTPIVNVALEHISRDFGTGVTGQFLMHS